MMHNAHRAVAVFPDLIFSGVFGFIGAHLEGQLCAAFQIEIHGGLDAGFRRGVVAVARPLEGAFCAHLDIHIAGKQISRNVVNAQIYLQSCL